MASNILSLRSKCNYLSSQRGSFRSCSTKIAPSSSSKLFVFGQRRFGTYLENQEADVVPADANKTTESHPMLELPHQMSELKFVVNEMIEMGRHTKITAGGRVYSFSALVIVGTGQGTAAVGYGKAKKPQQAVQNAFRDAKARLVSIHLHQKTIPHDIHMNYRGTRIMLKSLPKGYGMKGNYPVMMLARAFGLEDITIKTWRSRKTKKILYAIMHALMRYCMDPPQIIAKNKGLKYVDFNNIWRPPRYEESDPEVMRLKAKLQQKREEVVKMYDAQMRIGIVRQTWTEADEKDALFPPNIFANKLPGDDKEASVKQ